MSGGSEASAGASPRFSNQRATSMRTPCASGAGTSLAAGPKPTTISTSMPYAGSPGSGAPVSTTIRGGSLARSAR